MHLATSASGNLRVCCNSTPGKNFILKEDGSPYKIYKDDLHEGWNLVGNPFDVDISVDQIYVSTDATRYSISDVTQSETGHKLWYIDINLPEYQSVSTLSPFMGAWLYVENSAGAEVMFFRTPENPDLAYRFRRLRSQRV